MGEIMDSIMYYEILERNLLQFAKHLKLPKDSWLFHYDNYVKYTVVKMRVVKDREKGFRMTKLVA